MVKEGFSLKFPFPVLYPDLLLSPTVEGRSWNHLQSYSPLEIYNLIRQNQYTREVVSIDESESILLKSTVCTLALRTLISRKRFVFLDERRHWPNRKY